MAVAQLDSESLLTIEEESQSVLVWRRFRKHKLALAGMFTILVLAFGCFLAPWVAPYDPFALEKNEETTQIEKNAPPSLDHLMGTDGIGRDVFSRLLYAGRISLLVAFTVTFISLIIGVFVGGISGYYGGYLDDVIQRFVEFLITLPTLPLLLAFSALMRGVEIPGIPREWSSAIIISVILTAFGWMGYTNLVRGMVLSLRSQEFTEAAKALGMGSINIILKHMIPNSLAPIIVQATLSLGGVIITESALSFLGLGIQLPVPTWGNMLNEYQTDMWTQPAKVFYPGLTIFVCTLAFNYVGDGLRDALDPRLKK
ncbi:MAG: ABC transporter permease [Anaerolineales bacterium]